ncbi:TetR/AcrR family transcriptional regulator [Rhizobium sp. KVB221]|uniref:TetR/AcrR family transcriptional regulator n=1 Tax=Rhizobium setariae TaxID=2801340 RepID=A0A937CRL7_9HYPH|nr:TetR/AcrR family transcriptional regulator [Rhizobium setariae]MBL0374827.1 TetR/AcrR family transcriptional regulator [Rhizobium setariae]
MPVQADALVGNIDVTPVRDRLATSARILKSAAELLAEQGFQNFGINAVARRAGCDKQLIYRYFGGMNGLVEAIGADLAGWVEARMPENSGGGFLLTYGDLVERLLVLFMDALRSDPLMKKIIAWEMSDNAPEVRMLSEARSKALAQWIDRVGGNMQPPKGLDTTAMNALLIGAVQHLVLAGEAAGRLAGLSLKSDKDWQKAAQAVSKLVRGVYP